MSEPIAISYSGGASSRWIVEAVLNGTIARPEHVAVFFADTGDEHEWTYEDVDRTEERCRREGLDFIRTATHRGETLSHAILSATRGERKRLDQPPLWTENEGGGRGRLAQRCTQIWKSRALRRARAAWLKEQGLPKRITSWIGFGLDERHRANKAVARQDVNWERLDFPAIRLSKVRDQQRAEVKQWSGVDAPLFSCCVECPFKDEERWKQTTPRDLAKAVEIDEAIRHGLEHVGVENPAYLSDQLIPVADLVRGKRREKPPHPQLEIPGCDAGHCFL